MATDAERGAGASSALSGSRYALIVSIGFFLLLIPVARDGHYFFGDERFYTDGATRMLQYGDIFTPYYIDGLPHFNKPILTYWAVLASFKLFGIGVFASRLPSLIAGVALMGLTYRCAMLLLRRRDVALLAMVILGSNLIVISAATRATPDMLLAACLLASFCGFTSIVLRGDKSLANHLLAYVGAALALETKGLLALVALGYVLAFWAGFRRKTVRFSDLFEPRSVMLAVVVGVSWYAIAAYQHGSNFWNDFIGDQITDKINATHISHLQNIAFLLGSTLQNFLPWTALLLVAAIPGFGRIADFWRGHRLECGFVLGWYGTLVVVFCFGDLARGRYLLPAFPLLSIVLAGVLMEILRDERTATLVRQLSAGVLVVSGVCGLGVLAAGSFIDPRLVIGGAIVFAGSAALLYAISRHAFGEAPISLGIGVFLTIATAQALVRPVFRAAPEAALVQELLRRGVPSKDIGMVDLPIHAASHISLFSEGRLAVKPQPADVTWDALARYPVVLLSEASRERWSFDGYQIMECGREYPNWSAADLWRLVSSQDREQVFDEMKRPYFMASRDSRP